MGHHIDGEGRFQSDRHPDLAPDKIVLSFKDRLACAALATLATNYKNVDPGLAQDIWERLRTIGSGYEHPVPIVQPIVGKCRICGQDTIRASGSGYECGEHTQPVSS